MPRGPTTFRQRDLKAAVKAAQDGGLRIARIELRHDGVWLIAGDTEPNTAARRDPESVRNEKHLRNVIDKLKAAQRP